METLTILDQLAAGGISFGLVPWNGGQTCYAFSTERQHKTGVFIKASDMREMAQWLLDAAAFIEDQP